jgi:PAS domain S-box-containing protein
VFLTGQGIDDETEFTPPQGSARTYEYCLRPVFQDGVVKHVVGSTRDITNRKLAEEPLRASEARFRALFDQAAVGMVEFDNRGAIINTNDTYCRIVGRPHDEVVDKTTATYTHPDDVGLGGHYIRQIEDRSLNRATFEKRYIRPDGSLVWARATLSPVYDSTGRLDRLFGLVEDISEQKVAEEQMRFLMRVSDAARPLLDPTEIAAVVARLMGEFLEVDRCAYAVVALDQNNTEVTGNYTRGLRSLVGRWRLSDFGHDLTEKLLANQPYIVYDTATQLSVELRRLYQESQIGAMICVPIQKAGRLVATMAVHQAKPRIWTADEVQIVLAVATRCWESIERARVTNHYRVSEQRYRTFVDTVSSIVWLTDGEGAMTSDNPSWQIFTGQSWDEYRGFGWVSAIHPDDRDQALVRWQQTCDAGAMYLSEYRLRRHDGVYRHVIARGAPVKLPDGQIKEWVGNCTDNHDQRLLVEQNERLLESERAARTEAERTGRMKDEFLATLSHELRTPLSAILGWAQLLQHPGMTEEDAREGLATIERNARAQAQLIDDLLDMSRIISGKIRLDIQPVDLAAVLQAAISTVHHSAEAKRIEIRTDFAAGIEGILGDPQRLQQVVWNLLSNSIKFTPASGFVEVALRRQAPSREDTEQVEVTVTDSGAGIKPEFLPHVFERFRQADASTTRKFGGLGLGLAIVKQLVELHGGSIHVTSPGEQQGSTFRILLPVAKKPDSESRHAPRQALTLGERSSALARPAKTLLDWRPVDLHGTTILVVDDERDARELARRILEECRAHVILAAHGQQALALFAESPTFDLIVSDIGMPELDGYELLRRLRAAGHNLPAIALTAFARSEDRTQALLAGFQTHISKPVDSRELVAHVAALLGRTGESQAQ